jgi:hypothetical protein
MLQEEFYAYKYSSIALASLICVLENLGYATFKTGIIDLIHELRLPFDSTDVDACINTVQAVWKDCIGTEEEEKIGGE